MNGMTLLPPPLVFCLLIKISNSYLKMLDLSKLFVADAPITLKYGSENRL